jgi:fructose-1,6-bisphosphatase
MSQLTPTPFVLYATQILASKMADPELRSVIKTMFDGCGTITEALRKELVTVAEKQESVFGDVQLGVDVLADDLMWDICKTDPLVCTARAVATLECLLPPKRASPRLVDQGGCVRRGAGGA